MFSFLKSQLHAKSCISSEIMEESCFLMLKVSSVVYIKGVFQVSKTVFLFTTETSSIIRSIGLCGSSG